MLEQTFRIPKSSPVHGEVKNCDLWKPKQIFQASTWSRLNGSKRPPLILKCYFNLNKSKLNVINSHKNNFKKLVV